MWEGFVTPTIMWEGFVDNVGGVCNPDDNVGGVCNPECEYLFQPHITCPFVGPHIFIR